MTDYKSLMVGNVLMHKYDNGTEEGHWAANAVNQHDIVYAHDYPGNYRPIPLTPALLELLGFTYLVQRRQ